VFVEHDMTFLVELHSVVYFLSFAVTLHMGPNTSIHRLKCENLSLSVVLVQHKGVL
jgi:hypothetical protein